LVNKQNPSAHGLHPISHHKIIKHTSPLQYSTMHCLCENWTELDHVTIISVISKLRQDNILQKK